MLHATHSMLSIAHVTPSEFPWGLAWFACGVVVGAVGAVFASRLARR